GYEVVGLLKQYLGKISEKHQDRLEKSTAFKIIEYVIEHAAFVDDEGNYWLFNKGSTNDGIPMSIGLELGISDEAFSRRFYSLRKDKGWMCYEFDPDSDLDGITNVGVTPDGFDYYMAVLDKFKDEDKLPHQELIDTVEKLVLTGIEEAARNEDRNLMKEFMILGSPSEITEMDDDSLQERITEIMALLGTTTQQVDIQVAA
ncbi:MAG: hypothetical protein Q7T74_02970, partial [Candidatus Saccharibacteria bacterium]|nr:hypothetical protein [Candidatus Saccharibacteria bacterium]